jgi:hypothetical protein
VRDEKLKVIRALDPVPGADVVRGQYDGTDNKPDYRYRGVGNPESRTESFVALRARVSNWRWAGTPFYLRTGKRLKARKRDRGGVQGRAAFDLRLRGERTPPQYPGDPPATQRGHRTCA